MKWIGLTGGIATGKSTVKKLIEGLGFSVIDADQISHELSEIGTEGYKQILSQFGHSILNPDQTLNRKNLGQIIFNDLEKRKVLEKILHPLIKAEVAERKKAIQKSGASICFYDVPLLFEKNMQSQFDFVVLVWCDTKLQKHRLKNRNHLTNDEVHARLNSQVQMSSKIKNSHYCLDNSSDLISLEKQVASLLKTIG